MPDHSAESAELQRLRGQVAEFEQIFRLAAPRLAAFKRLEEIARERKTTPEAVASEAALDVLKREQEGLIAEATEIARQRDTLRGELAMLLENKQDAIQVIDDLKIEHDDINQEVAEILGELNLLRNDAVRLMTERRELELEVEALRAELAEVEDLKAAAVAAMPPPEVEPERASSKTPDFDIDEAGDQEEGRLFDKFFHAGVEHDKARDWILG